MKACILLSGQIRNNKDYYKSIKENLIDLYNADVFISTWYDSNNPTSDSTIEEIIDMYKPVSIEVEQHDIVVKSFLKKMVSPYEWRTPGPETNALSVFSMFYKIMRANRLREIHERMNLFTYDVVIRTRFDLSIDSPIGILKPKENHLYLPKGWDWRNGYNDLFAIGDSRTMTYYSNAFNNLLPILDMGHMLHPEYLLKVYLDMSGYTLVRPLMDLSIRGIKVAQKEAIY